VRAFRDLRYDAEQREYFVLVSWLGFDEADNTWEPLLALFEDLPQEVAEFLAVFPSSSLAARARDTLSQESPFLLEGGV
jgi:hypothetical protein